MKKLFSVFAWDFTLDDGREEKFKKLLFITTITAAGCAIWAILASIVLLGMRLFGREIPFSWESIPYAVTVIDFALCAFCILTLILCDCFITDRDHPFYMGNGASAFNTTLHNFLVGILFVTFFTVLSGLMLNSVHYSYVAAYGTTISNPAVVYMIILHTVAFALLGYFLEKT